MNKESLVVLLGVVTYVSAVTIIIMLFSMERHQYDQGYFLEPITLIDIGETPKFKNLSDIPQRKAEFFSYFEKLTKNENALIQQQRAQLMMIKPKVLSDDSLGYRERRTFDLLRENYNIDASLGNKQAIDELMLRVNIVPVALAQVQAAIESGWGTSRFAVEANNYFGQWCFSKGCGLVPSSRTDNKRHEVRRFNSPEGSLKAYVKNLNTFHVYAELRESRAKLDQRGKISAMALADSLLAYSERGQDYIDQVKGMISANGLE